MRIIWALLKKKIINESVYIVSLQWLRSNEFFYRFLWQIYQIENVIVKAAISPRPAAWILERSLDGEIYRPWQYYAPSDEECWSRYSVQPMTGKPQSIGDDEVVCTSIYSRQTPMENGEVRDAFFCLLFLSISYHYMIYMALGNLVGKWNRLFCNNGKKKKRGRIMSA